MLIFHGHHQGSPDFFLLHHDKQRCETFVIQIDREPGLMLGKQAETT